MNSLAHGNIFLTAEITNISSHGIWLFSNTKEYFLSYADFPWFKQQSVQAITHIEEPSTGHFYWPEIDIDLSLDMIKNPSQFPLTAK